MKIKAILFDLGETLLMFGRVDTFGLLAQGAKLSYDFLKGLGQPLESFERYFWHSLISLRWHHLLSNITGNDFDSMLLLKKIGTKKGIKLDASQWEELVWLWYKPLSLAGKTEPDIAKTLDELKKMGIKLGIVSNTFVHSSAIKKHLRHLGISDFFDIELYSYQFDFRKPDMRIFRTAIERIGEPAENIMFVGDRIDNDITPAMSMGMTAVLKQAYTNSGRIPANNVRRISRLSELPGLVRAIQ